MAKSKNMKMGIQDVETIMRGAEPQQPNDTETQKRKNVNSTSENTIPAAAPEEVPVTPYRKKIARTNGSTYYLENKHIEALKLIKCYNGSDKQDVIRTALDLFLAKYMSADGHGLNEDGVGEIERYMTSE